MADEQQQPPMQETVKPRKARVAKALKYAYPYDEWKEIIRPYYLTIADVIKMNPKEAMTLIYLPKTVVNKEGSKVLNDKIYDAEKFTEKLGLRRKYRKSADGEKGLTLNGRCQGNPVRLQVQGKQKRALDPELIDVDAETNVYGPSNTPWYDLNRRGSYVGLDGCYMIDASNLFRLPKVFIPNKDDSTHGSDIENE